MSVTVATHVSRGRSVLHVAGFALLVIGVFLAAGVVLHAVGVNLHGSGREERPISIIGTLILASIVLGVTSLMARIERASLFDYGLRDSRATNRAATGAIVGLLAIAALILGLRAVGSLELHAIVQPEPAAVAYALVWVVGYGLVAFAEETLFRGYALAALTRAAGKPAAAIITSLIFGLLHLGNGGESWLAAVNAVLLALVLATSVYMTGSLWWAIGFHAAWNWGESWLFGAADSGVVAAGRLLEATPRGAWWLSGGEAGPEGSIGMLIVIVLVMLALWRTARIETYAEAVPLRGH